MKSVLAFLVLCFIATSACTTQVYLIDRQTVLELEASGAWPELDQKFKDAAIKAGAIPLENTNDRASSRKIFSMTHDDKTSN